MRRVAVREENENMARLKDMYKAEVAPALMKKFGYKSVMQIPKQGARGHAHRREGNPQRRADV